MNNFNPKSNYYKKYFKYKKKYLLLKKKLKGGDDIDYKIMFGIF